jgi:hypothetical protein
VSNGEKNVRLETLKELINEFPGRENWEEAFP